MRVRVLEYGSLRVTLYRRDRVSCRKFTPRLRIKDGLWVSM